MLLTPRLRLRAFSPHDLEAFVAYRREPATARYQSWTTSFSEEQGRAFIARVTRSTLGGPEWVNLAVEHTESGVLVGDVGLHRLSEDDAEIGFTFAQAHRGKGLAREAVGALVQHAFDVLSVTRVVAHVDARNERAAKLLLALSFREVHRSHDVEYKGERCEEVTFERRR